MMLRSARTLAIATLALTWGSAHPALSQDQTEPAKQTIELAEKPLNLPGIGLEIRLPLGSTSTQQSLSREVFAEVLGEDNLWRITLTSKTSSNKNLQPEDAAKQIRENLQQSFGALRPRGMDNDESFQSFAPVLDDVAAVPFSGGVAYRFLIKQPAPAPGVPDTVRGVAVIGIGEGQMLVWDLSAPATNYELAKSVLDTTLKGVVAIDANLSVPDREIALKTGHALLRGIDAKTMREIFDSHGERWYRLYRSSDDSSEEREIGYRYVRAWAGQRSDVGGKGSISAAEGNVPGYVVQIKARSLDENTSGPDQLVYDSEGTYFVSEDFKKEAWKLRLVIRRGNESTNFTEIGARDGFEELLVTTSSPNGRDESYRQKIKEEGYLPLPLALILPSILAETGAIGDVAFYTYRSDAAAVTFRHDAIRHDTSHPGQFIHSTSVSIDSPRITKEIASDGEVLREELPGDRYWEKTTIDELVRIWKAKGLPMD
jgi:hypothetical protein